MNWWEKLIKKYAFFAYVLVFVLFFGYLLFHNPAKSEIDQFGNPEGVYDSWQNTYYFNLAENMNTICKEVKRAEFNLFLALLFLIFFRDCLALANAKWENKYLKIASDIANITTEVFITFVVFAYIYLYWWA